MAVQKDYPSCNPTKEINLISRKTIKTHNMGIYIKTGDTPVP